MTRRRSLAARTGIAAAAAAAVALAVVALVLRNALEEQLLQRVDDQLEERAGGAPILAAIADRLAVSELSGVVQGARVVFTDGPDADQQTLQVGALPVDELPPVDEQEWSTVHADGEGWRLHTVEVRDVPRASDRALVQLVAPLGDVDAQVREQQRRSLAIVLLTIAGAGLAGWLFGARAARPLRRLRRDATRIGHGPRSAWHVGSSYGTPEVDDIAGVLNDGVTRIAAAAAAREEALEASRAFAASAAHELRTPLTSAATNLDVARSAGVAQADHDEALADARVQIERAGATLAALRALADADLATDDWFDDVDVADVAAVVVEEGRRRWPDVELELDAPPSLVVRGWEDGIRLACTNLVRNAVDHGRPPGGVARVRVVVHAEQGAARIAVEDNGAGIPDTQRAAVVQRFRRGDASQGTGLGLALVSQVARAHGGSVEISDAPMGGARVVLVVPILESEV